MAKSREITPEKYHNSPGDGLAPWPGDGTPAGLNLTADSQASGENLLTVEAGSGNETERRDVPFTQQ